MKYFLLFVLLCLGSGWIFGQSDSPYFLVDGSEAAFPLESTTADVDIAGVIANVTVEQVYTNRGSQAIEATYVFPASTEAAVHGMEMYIGDRRIEGVVMRKAGAKATYETAKAEGKRSSLLEQHRPNVFQMRVANILPGDTVRVRLQYTELLVPAGGTYRFVYPTVVGPRFTGEDEKGEGFAGQPYSASGTPTRFSLQLHLAAGMPIASLESPTHPILITPAGPNATDLRLDPGLTAPGNRDFVLEYQLGGAGIHTGLLLYEGEEENYFLYMAQPPVATSSDDDSSDEDSSDEVPAREFVFIVDVSGSMTGFPLDVTKKLMADLVSDLRPRDYFNILLFAGAADTWRSASAPATRENLAAATEWVEGVRGGGGTELLAALRQAYALPAPGESGRTTARPTSSGPEALSRNFVIVTDGYISVEPEVFDLIDQHLDRANVYTFGIGGSVNRHLIDGMARVGRGRPAVVLDEAAAAVEARRFREYIAKPLLTDVRLSYAGFDVYDLEPLSLPDLGSERPLIVFGKYRGKPKGELVLSGSTGAGDLLTTYRVRDSHADPQHAALAYLWARHRIQRLDDYNQLSPDDQRVEEVTRLGLDHNLLTRYTSFVAVDKTPAREPGTDLTTVKQPLPLPAGVSANAVGFSLGVAGVSGLPTQSSALPWWSYATVAAVLALFFVGFRKLRSLSPLVLLLLVFTACKPKPDTRAETALMPERAPEVVEPVAPTSNTTHESKVAPITTPPVATSHTEEFLAATNDITFILGRDQSDNPYFARAERYFREQGAERIVTGLESLAAVRYYLDSRRPREGWGRIHLVVHGNPWSGLAVGRTAAEKRTTAQQLSEWSPAPLSGINEATRIVLHGCGLGSDRDLLRELSRVFGGERTFPEVEATEQFTLFREGPRGMERHYADAYFRARPLGDYPLPSVMAVRFGRKYPHVAVDWEAALSRDRFTEALLPYLYQFNVPVEWLHVHPEGGAVYLPGREAEQAAWLEGEEALIRELARIGLTHADFRWTFDRTTYRLADGSRIPAARALGTSRLFCVLVPVDQARTVRQRYFRDA
ncbi:von Willebrand factor type A domain-containing protein [Neolewinella xylanilytica]|uniref:von Willebrand factor type A domain-containing protein n=1 Tax=Neolewinella xylanilytica TaxID=1514080 RepID=A0A2S6IB09_9BACT|nr:VIT domain-containing protein [Neolewinella xylanilytica]PPK88665.1 von Willebrand factor type A domain-containing protein [Neolewinella xylanilytica]